MFDNLPFYIFIYELNGILIDYVETHKDLGVMADSKLSRPLGPGVPSTFKCYLKIRHSQKNLSFYH